jgi:protein-disulfide isomerase
MGARIALAPLLIGLAAGATGLACHRKSAETTSVAVAVSDAGRSAEDDYWSHPRPVFRVPVGGSPVLGAADAWVTVVAFSDLASASCGAMDATLRAARAKLGDRVRIVWKNRPRRSGGEAAAEAALEVRSEQGDTAFWRAHDLLVDRRSAWLAGDRLDMDALVSVAREAGGDAEKVRRAITTRAHREEIEADVDLAEDFEVEATPHLFVNGRRIEGLQPPAMVERAIDEEMKRALALVDGGAPSGSIYDAAIAGGVSPWRPRTISVPRLPANDPALGDADAKVAVHVWSDYQCALCTAVERTIGDLKKSRGDRVRWVWHDLPLARHKDARLLAEAAREAYAQKGARAFWAMHDAIAFAPAVPGAADLDGIARGLSLDLGRWRAALDGDKHAPAIAADEAAASGGGITETPSFLVVVRGATEGALVGNVEYASKLPRVVEAAVARAYGDDARDERDERGERGERE